MSYNELKRHKKRVAFVSNTSSFTGWSDNFGAKWQLWCQSDDFNQKVWVAMHGVGWRVKKVMTSVCWHHHVENVRKDRCRSMRRHRFSMWDTYVPTCYLREYTYRSDISNTPLLLYVGIVLLVPHVTLRSAKIDDQARTSVRLRPTCFSWPNGCRIRCWPYYSYVKKSISQ